MSSRKLRSKRQRKTHDKRYKSEPDHGLLSSKSTPEKRSKSDPLMEVAQSAVASSSKKARPLSASLENLLVTEKTSGKTEGKQRRDGIDELSDGHQRVKASSGMHPKHDADDNSHQDIASKRSEPIKPSPKAEEKKSSLGDMDTVSSLFDILTFGVFSNVLHATSKQDMEISSATEEKTHSVPAEIRARGREACEAFQEALENGQTKDRRLPLMVIGQARAGKTSTIRSLRGEEFDASEDSTPGITLDRTLSELRKEYWAQNWSAEGGAVDVTYDHVMAKTVAEKLAHITHHSHETLEEDDPDEIDSSANGGDNDMKDTVRHHVQVPEDIAELVQQLLQDVGKDSSSTNNIYSMIWDFAGQPTYCATHPVFMSPRALYLLVHDLSTDLQAWASPSVKSGPYQRSPDKANPLTNMDWLELWMSSICQISSEQCSLSSDVDERSNRNSDIIEYPPHGDVSSPETDGKPVIAGLSGHGDGDGKPVITGLSGHDNDKPVITEFNHGMIPGKHVITGLSGQSVSLSATTDNVTLSVSIPQLPDLESTKEQFASTGSSSSLPDLMISHISPKETWRPVKEMLGVSPFATRDVPMRNKAIKLPKKAPPVFLVCTHSDEPYEGSDPLETGRHILKTLKRKPSGHHIVRAVYTVNNSLAGGDKEDPQVGKLRENIHEIAQKLLQVREPIPIRWLQFEKVVASLIEKGFNSIKLPEAERIAEEVCQIDNEREFRTLLNYLHDLKVIIHFEDSVELNRLVILDPQWLANMFASVITVQPVDCQDSDFEEDWAELEREGILTYRLVRHVWGHATSDVQTIDTLLSIMQKFSLLCKWRRHDGTEVFLVPSMLLYQPSDQVQQLVSSADLLPMVVRFSSGFLPLGFFPRFLVLLVEWCAELWPGNRQPKFYNNFARFYLGSNGNYSLITICDMCTLAVVIREESAPPAVFASSDEDTMLRETIETVCQTVVSFVKRTLKKMRLDFPWMRSMQTELCVRCPVCVDLNVGRPCLSHGVLGCTRDSCMHYISEAELRMSDRVRCLQSPAATQPVIDADRYQPWFNEDDEDESYREDILVRVDLSHGLVPKAMETTLLKQADPSEVITKLAEDLHIDRNSQLTKPEIEKVRAFCGFLKKNNRTDIVRSLRDRLPSGVTGPLLPDNGLSKQLPEGKRRELTRALSGGDYWKIFASRLGVPQDQLPFYDQRIENPAETILAEFERKTRLKIGELYDILVMCELEAFADKL